MPDSEHRPQKLSAGREAKLNADREAKLNADREAKLNAHREAKLNAHRETLDLVHEISTLLNTGLSLQQLTFCVYLIEKGVDPNAIADLMKTLNARYPKEKKDAE